MQFSARESARSLLTAAVSGLVSDGVIPAAPASVPVESPKRPEHGDFASNIALALAKAAGRPPRAVAEAIVARLEVGGQAPLHEATIAGPGFINLRFSNLFWQRALSQVLAAGPDWGRRPYGGEPGVQGEAQALPRVLLEFISANPTGPMHVAHGRHAAVGDTLARLLRFAGYPVTCEFYVNDAGNQVQMLSLSVWARYMEAAREADPSVPAAIRSRLQRHSRRVRHLHHHLPGTGDIYFHSPAQRARPAHWPGAPALRSLFNTRCPGAAGREGGYAAD